MDNPTVKYNASAKSGRLFDRAVIRLHPSEAGEDVRGFLQGLVTQDTALVQPDTPQWTGLLTPQGKALFDFILWADDTAPDDILIDCEARAADALIKRLSIYRLRRKIVIALEPTLGVFWSLEGAQGYSDPRLAELGHRWMATTGDADQDTSRTYQAHRLSLRVTEGLAELGDGETLWLEANAAELNGVSFVKGCYIGQENTARMNWRQKVNRRLVVVPLAQADPKRQRLAYPDQGLSVELRRVEDISALVLPAWLGAALAKDVENPA